MKARIIPGKYWNTFIVQLENKKIQCHNLQTARHYCSSINEKLKEHNSKIKLG